MLDIPPKSGSLNYCFVDSSIVTVIPVAGASWKAGIKVPGARSHTAAR